MVLACIESGTHIKHITVLLLEEYKARLEASFQISLESSYCYSEVDHDRIRCVLLSEGKLSQIIFKNTVRE